MTITIDIGTNKTKVFVKNKGIVFCQATAVAYDMAYEKIIAIGDEAYDMIDRLPESVSVKLPVKSGVICDYAAMKSILSFLINKFSAGAVCKPDFMFVVPSSCTDLQKKTIIDLACTCGAGRVSIIEEPVASAYGCCLDIKKPFGNLVIDIGAGTTDIAIISMDCVVASSTLAVGGNDFDEAISQYIRREKGYFIGRHTAEKIKNTVGSAKVQGEKVELFVSGKNVITALPEEFSVSTEETFAAIEPLLRQIADEIRSVMESVPAEMYTDICNGSMLFTGGCSRLKNLAAYFSDYFHIDVSVVQDGENSAVKGAGYVLKNLDSFEDAGYVFKLRHQERFNH